MLNTFSTIGIWGLGIVGKSAVRFFSRQGYRLIICDNKQLSDPDVEFLSQHHALQHHGSVDEFLNICDVILPSPGIDLRPYCNYQHKFINELDIFASHYHKPIIAITGSVGKTTVTHLLSQMLLQSGARVLTGGNIGIGMLDLLHHDDAQNSDYCVLELSSFQLEQCKSFAPSLALWTNLYPNHLDRHGTLHDYFLAKCGILRHQEINHHALIPLRLAQDIRAEFPSRSFNFFLDTAPTDQDRALLQTQDTLFYIDEGNIYKLADNTCTGIADLKTAPPVTFAANWLAIYAACSILGVRITHQQQSSLALPSHRLEKTATINNIDFYDDSKATIPESTLAAVQQLSQKSIVLFLGGISKGVDRSTLIKQMPKTVKHIVCFGREAEQLYQWCSEYGISSSVHKTLEEAFNASLQYAQSGDQVLFSPAGASYDLFNNYQERGHQFKKLVQQLSA